MKKIIVPDEALEDYHMILELEYLRNEVKELKILNNKLLKSNTKIIRTKREIRWRDLK